MHTLDELEKHLGELPVFPLPQAVFFPNTVLPLHIFEPRYREMIRDARDLGLPIAVALLRPEAGRDDSDRPYFEPIAGAGFIGQLEELPDGRFLLELEGVARVRVTGEHSSDRMYRKVVAELLPDAPYDVARAEAEVETMSLIAMGLRAANPRISEFLSSLIEQQPSPAAVSNAVASVLFPEADIRQGLLEELRPDERLKIVVARLSEVLALATSPDEDTQFN